MKLLSSVQKFKSSIFRVTFDRAIDPDGFEIKRAIVHHGGSAVMMPVDEKGRILLVRQYRLAARQYLWEVPAGRVDPGETVLQAARRELKEETGYKASKWTRLSSFYVSPGFLSEKMTVYAAEHLTAGEQQPMEDERIEMRWFTQAEIDHLIASQQLQDAKTMLAFLTWKRYHRGAAAGGKGTKGKKPRR
jgi:ADP-ribose pyrophosphatase